MIRKLVKQGAATMMISLPARWIKFNQLGKGDEINLEEKENEIRVTTGKIDKKKKEIIFLSTPYDTKSVDMLFDLGISAFKVASTDMNNHEILSHISKKNKPIILSTAMSFQEEVISSINLLLTTFAILKTHGLTFQVHSIRAAHVTFALCGLNPSCNFLQRLIAHL